VLFLLLAGAGTAWLIHVARSYPDEPARLVDAGDGPAPAAGSVTPGPTPADPRPSSPGTGPGSTTADTGAVPVPAATGGHRAGPATGRASPAPPVTRAATDPPVPVRAIRVGGVTLDDTSPRTHCYLVRNVAVAEPVRITRISAGNPDVVVKPDLCAGTVAQESTGDWTPTFACRADSVLQPGGDGCYTGIEPRLATLTGPQRSTITLALRARCTSASGHPCSDSGDPEPTSGRPVDVTWSESYDGTLCYLAGGQPPDTIFC
jgi:hypothetical protein